MFNVLFCLQNNYVLFYYRIVRSMFIDMFTCDVISYCMIYCIRVSLQNEVQLREGR